VSEAGGFKSCSSLYALSNHPNLCCKFKACVLNYLRVTPVDEVLHAKEHEIQAEAEAQDPRN
jgi:hypothetical protein